MTRLCTINWPRNTETAFSSSPATRGRDRKTIHAAMAQNSSGGMCKSVCSHQRSTGAPTAMMMAEPPDSQRAHCQGAAQQCLQHPRVIIRRHRFHKGWPERLRRDTQHARSGDAEPHRDRHLCGGRRPEPVQRQDVVENTTEGKQDRQGREQQPAVQHAPQYAERSPCRRSRVCLWVRNRWVRLPVLARSWAPNTLATMALTPSPSQVAITISPRVNPVCTSSQSPRHSPFAARTRCCRKARAGCSPPGTARR